MRGEPMEIRADGFVLRPWRAGDEAALVEHANNRKIWRNLSDRFPHPYQHRDAVEWITRVTPSPGEFHFAIDLPSIGPVGGAGLVRQKDLRHRTAEIGYWLGEVHWGKGIATEAARRLTEYAFSQHDFVRLQAHVLAWNPASARVLEKAGYVLESVERNGAYKDGEVVDLLIYARIRNP